MSIELYHNTSFRINRLITSAYSTSFGIAVMVLPKDQRNAISSIYGFVRLADEIVDTFHDHDKKYLLSRFRDDTFKAIEEKISLNPVLHSFQLTVNQFRIPAEYIHDFLKSMEMDIYNSYYDRSGFDTYVYGSAEAVGLMCLRVFCNDDKALFERLSEPARALGAAFQKVNFLRDVKSDIDERGRVYFPSVTEKAGISMREKLNLEEEIEKEFRTALEGIRQLPAESRFAVYSAYQYYNMLFKKIRSSDVAELLQKRIRVSNFTKIALLMRSFVATKFADTAKESK